MNKHAPLTTLFLVIASAGAWAAPLALKDAASAPADFPLALNGRAAPIIVDKADAEVVRIAADLLAGDIQRVSGVKPTVGNNLSGGKAEAAVIVGTFGKSALITDLAKRGKLDVSGIEGKWESSVVATIKDPFPGLAQALVIAGSDRRGTAYGVVDVSRVIGVSPWVWWADVAPQRRDALVLNADAHVQGPPSVKFRGIFINDEDWGLQPWAAKTFEPETKDIGPKTYAKVCELLLRLKANYMWSAMHPCTKAFNHYPENKFVAHRYAIVMGSSHAEPMLRNNVDEWDAKKFGDWNPVTNLPRILKYWEDRVRENGKYENTYTVGMRGIHDSAMPGGGTLADKRERLEKLIGLQRDMLAKYVNPNPALVPQIFCPYKEVLTIYRAGLEVPGDVTIVWPDDNFGYIRQLPDESERKRSGGSGIYYHLSYWGAPHDYLWLDSIAPALVWHEMRKAYDLGARQLWVVNVGDIKAIETGMTCFLDLAWDINRYGPDVQKKFLRDFYATQFGEKYADRIAALRDEYYRLCAIRKPEHLGFNRVYFSKAVPNTPVQDPDWPQEQSDRLLKRWLDVARQTEALAAELPPASRDSYFQLVEYPASGGAAMAEKLLLASKARLTGSTEAAQQAKKAFERIGKLTDRYNALAGGKWRGMMDYQPRKLPVFDMPSTTAGATPAPPAPTKNGSEIEIDAAKFTASRDADGVGWRAIKGLGPREAAIAVLPHKDTPTLRSPQEIRDRAPVTEYAISGVRAGDITVTVEALPTHRITSSHELLTAVSFDDGEPVLIDFPEGKDNETDKAWQAQVLSGARSGQATVKVPANASKLKLWAADPSVVVQRITLLAAQK